MKTKLLIITLALTMFAACGPGPDPVLELQELQLTEEEQILNSRQNQAGIDLLRLHASDEEENTIISPLSINIASAMLANGAKNATQEQILNAIGAEDYSIDFLNDYYAKCIPCFNSPSVDCDLDIHFANGLWLDDDLHPVFNFVKAINRSYWANVDIIDLGTPAAAKVINDWASLNTKKLIGKVVDETMFNDDTRFVLANAIYFKGCWQSEFKTKNTRKGDFHLADGTTIQTDMMHQTGKFQIGEYVIPNETRYVTTPDARILRMPFRGGYYYMDIILPNNNIGCADFLDQMLDMELMDALEKSLVERNEVYVQLPKFTLKDHLDLIPDLKALGMVDVFTDAADLSGIDSTQFLSVGQFLHDTYLEVNEEGAKAAAVTTVIGYTSAAEPTYDFIVDRPFLLFIREAKYGTILFAAKIGHPSK